MLTCVTSANKNPLKAETFKGLCHVNTMDQRETVQEYSGGFVRLRAASVLVSPGRQNQWRFTPLPCVRTEASGGRTDGFVPMCGAQKIPDIQTHKGFRPCRYDESCNADCWTQRSDEMPCRNCSCCADARGADSRLRPCQ